MTLLKEKTTDDKIIKLIKVASLCFIIASTDKNIKRFTNIIYYCNDQTEAENVMNKITQ